MLIQFVIFVLAFLAGMLCAIWYGKSLHRFTWREYVLMLLFPTAGLMWLASDLGRSILVLFAVTSLLATMGEGTFGYLYHKAFGARLWTYSRYSIGGYTSLLVVPIWGFVSVLFFLFVNTFFIT